MPKTDRIKFVLIPIIFLSYYLIGYHLQRADFNAIMLLVSLQFLILIWCFKRLTFFWWLPICLRLLFLATIPNLSDDFYRFIYDGRLVASVQNPYLFLPNQLPVNEIFKHLNSPNYYSVYPPINQLFFWIGSNFSANNILANVILLRIIIILFDVGNIYLIGKFLRLFNLPINNVWLYALNPLIIIELTGNLHFEGVMLFFILVAFWYLQKAESSIKLLTFSAFLLSISISIKLIPLMFLPFVIRQIGWQKGLIYFSIVAVFNVLYFLPFYDPQIFVNISKSLNLYFQSFEFNGSVYYLIRGMGKLITGYNEIQVIGPILKLLSFLAILLLFLKSKNEALLGKENSDEIRLKNTVSYCLIALTIYLLLATTVHPWYLVTLVGLACLTSFRYSILWSFLIFLSYSAYISMPIQENLWVVALEYLMLFAILLFEKDLFLRLFTRKTLEKQIK